MTEWPTAEHLSRPGAAGDTTAERGKLQIVGIGPGHPEHLTQAARRAIQAADTIYAAPLYQEFLDEEGLCSGDPIADSRPEIVDSAREDSEAQARATFQRVQAGETVVHVSGGDPTVYGKSDLLVALAETEADGAIPIEVIPGVTAALGGAAVLGAPLSNDFCTVSLSSSRREQAEIDRKLEAAAEAGFVIALYNCWQTLETALETISAYRSGSVPVALLEDITRGELGRAPGGEAVSIASLAEAGTALNPETPGSLAIIGTDDSRVLRPADGDRPFLVTPRGDETPLAQQS